MKKTICDICGCDHEITPSPKTFVLFNFGTDEGYVGEKDLELCKACKEIYSFWISQGVVAIAEGDASDKKHDIKYKLRTDWLFLAHKIQLHKKRGWK